MKFAMKVFLSTVMVVAISFSIGGTLLILHNLDYSLEEKTQQAAMQHLTFRYLLETELQTMQGYDEHLQDQLLKNSGKGLSSKMTWSNQRFCLMNSHGEIVYSNMSIEAPALSTLKINEKLYSTVIKEENTYSVLTATLSDLNTSQFTLITSMDIAYLFEDINRQKRDLFTISLCVVLLSSVLLFALSFLLTRPIIKLNQAAKQIASGIAHERIAARGDDEVSELTNSFNLMAISIEEKMQQLEDYAKSREDFVRNFTHEVKTPMTAIIGYSDLLRSKKCDEDTILESSNYIFHEAKRLEELSHKLLSLMKLREIKLDLTPVEILPVLENAVNTVRPSCSRNGITLTLHGESCIVWCDTELLQTLLINLIDNSRKACTVNGKIEVIGEAKGNQYRICVFDNGCGMSPADIPKVKEAFYMADPSRKRRENAFGLGLSLANEIARLHGSLLTIDSTPQSGTSVCITLRRGDSA